ncbi:hypothetical protein SAMN05428945_6005 [Streptomyces sp. 2224.1]|nr:hypothetical protein BX261_6544 [Streptomyces sp. 2321.6]SDQ83783.1 hypothetical protein SAMN05216511_0706 [Streptomyces sp. KS_16]SED65006.1 hypothetical protein SAMN05428954_0688 [Streptomyces sp. 2112.3]SED91050.1 hypothetical protein SAMN05428945_6005 [Streptomyces sp. 2224.1]SED99006.1 hypothetical protein SAMN05428940_6572 [Streptomyces sp. 2133.1]SNC73393.1 hypothetical protein SAMN06272741_6474 [Streptomyces sp. 2114.4]
MRFAAYTHRHHTQVAVVENDTLYPLPGVRSLTEIIDRGEGPEALLDAGAAALAPSPTTTKRRPAARSRRRATASSRVRSTCTPASSSWSGSVRGRSPVAMTSASPRTTRPVAVVTARSAASQMTAGSARMNSAFSEARCSGERS